MVSNAVARLITLPLVFLGWVYALSPGWIRASMACTVGLCLRIAGFRARVIDQNLKYAFPGDGPDRLKERAILFKKAYQHIGHLFFEVCMVLGPWGAMKYFVKASGELKGLEHWKKEIEKGKGVIFLSSHVGSWEAMAAIGAVNGYEAVIVTKRLKPPWFHALIEAGRKNCRIRGAYEPKTLSTVLKQLQSGGTVAFVLDQYAGPPVGVRVPLFGIPAGTGTIVAALSKRTGCPVLPVVNHRSSNGRITVEIRQALPFDFSTEEAPSPRELALNTARYVSVIEKDIYDHPDQWLWSHRRFKGDLSPIAPDEWDRRARS